jgi:hypothetical protein
LNVCTLFVYLYVDTCYYVRATIFAYISGAITRLVSELCYGLYSD